ncbi:MAG: helix-turn-helix domain-containing protein [Solirubrobacterales bacterium]
MAAEPWRDLPAAVADVIEPELPAITGEILATISLQVPEYARPLEGNFGRNLRTGVGEALRQFVALIRDPDAGRGTGREVYVELGRGEQREGRALDSLLAAYRSGARVAWRRIAAACGEAGIGPQPLILLAEAIFAYIDELSADSAEGYAAAQAEVEDERRERRRRLAGLLLAEPPAAPDELTAAARAAAWRLPRLAAAAACAEADLAALARRLPPETLAVAREGVGCLVIPDPDGPGRATVLERAAVSSRLALGPAAAPSGLADSWALAGALLRASESGAVPPAGLLRADDHLAALLLAQGAALTARIAAIRLAPLADLTPKARARMRETALAHVRHGGNAVAIATELQIHPQTARYRIARLRELLGDSLVDPDRRFELELALRGAAVRDGGSQGRGTRGWSGGSGDPLHSAVSSSGSGESCRPKPSPPQPQNVQRVTRPSLKSPPAPQPRELPDKTRPRPLAQSLKGTRATVSRRAPKGPRPPIAWFLTVARRP